MAEVAVSYDEDTGLDIVSASDPIVMLVRCPRCGAVVSVQVDMAALFSGGVDVECRNRVCADVGQRAGWFGTMTARFSGAVLGLNDRPLNRGV